MTHVNSGSSQYDFTSEARALGYFPFIRFSPLEYLALRELHGNWLFEDLLPRLGDPFRIFPQWAISFCATAATFPREDLKASADIHALVTSSPVFKRRRGHLNAFQRVFFGSIWRKVKAGTLDLPGCAQNIAWQDQVRWRMQLAGRRSTSDEKRRVTSPNSGKPIPKKKDRAADTRALVVIKGHTEKSKTAPAARNVWRNPRPCEPLQVKRRI